MGILYNANLGVRVRQGTDPCPFQYLPPYPGCQPYRLTVSASLTVQLGTSMSCPAISCHLISCHLISCHLMPCHLMSCHLMSCHLMPCHLMSCHAISCHAISCHAISCHAISCHAISCHARPEPNPKPPHSIIHYTHIWSSYHVLYHVMPGRSLTLGVSIVTRPSLASKA